MTTMFGKTVGAAALVAALGFTATPLGAQQAAPRAPAAPGQGAEITDTTVQRTGAAIRDISGIQSRFNQRMQGSEPGQQEALEREANSAAEAALASRGLTVEQYNGVLRLAQNDPALRERLVDAARSAR